jgi:PAS domain-containing protein
MLDDVAVDTTHRWESTDQPASASIAEQLAPALARLELGGDLANSDRDLLDRLSPQNCLTFLVSDSVWLHPDNLPLFDYSVIDNLVAQCGSAVMTHYYRPRPGFSETYAVQTAIVNPGWEQPLVLGVFGPCETIGEDARRQSFEQMVSDMRTAYQIAATAVRRVRTELARPEPVLVVSPGDGKVIAGNRAAATALEVTLRELAGLPFQDIAHLLNGVTNITRLDSGPVDFSLISVTPSTASTRPSEEQPETAPTVTDLGSALKQMFSAIDDLEKLTRRKRDGVSAGVMHTIYNQAQILRGRLTHLTGVSDNDR